MDAQQASTEIFDFIIVGTGAGGSACAYQLARAGRTVLLLEKGDDLPTDGTTYDAKIVVAGGFNSTEAWHDGAGGIFRPEEHFNVGGKTRWYGAALLRPDPHEFLADSTLSMPGWPIAHAEMVPYFEQAEALLQVRTFDAEADLQRMIPHFERGGWKTVPMPLGISGDIVGDPVQETHWDGYALPDAWKAEARFHLIEPIEKLSNFTLLKNTEVETLLPAEQATRIAGVRCKDGREFRGHVVLLAAGALHSPRILQRYLASSGLDSALPAARNVGRYFKRHILSAVMGFSPRRKRDQLSKTRVWTHEQFPHSTVQPLGGWADVEAVRFALRFFPGFLREIFALRSYGFFLQTEDSSVAENRVTQQGLGEMPKLDYTVDRMPELRDEHAAMRQHFRRALGSAGFVNFKQSIPLSGLAHCVGTLATGLDPETSVVDPQGRVHGMDNLYVVDGSILPRISKMNPALTIYAWGLRVASLLLHRA